MKFGHFAIGGIALAIFTALGYPIAYTIDKFKKRKPTNNGKVIFFKNISATERRGKYPRHNNNNGWNISNCDGRHY